MIIRGVSAENFKSFRSFDVSLGDYNLVVGANASGKSNFVSCFRFLGDIHEQGLENAIANNGGADYIKHLKLSKDQPVSLTVKLAQRLRRSWHLRDAKLALRPQESTYSLRFAFLRGGRFEVQEDKFETSFFLHELKSDDKLGEKVGQGVVSVIKHGDTIDVELTGLPQTVMETVMADIRKTLPPKVPYEYVILDQRLWWVANYSAGLGPSRLDIGMYDFDPRLSKKSIPTGAKRDLEPDGSNLALVLKALLSNKQRSRKLHNLIQDLLPFVQKVGVLDQQDKSVLLTTLERYFGKRELPALMISDGTINVVALIISLYFEDTSVAVLEEPERSLHPQLMSKIVQMMKDASKSKQIVVTTHNPEMVRCSGLDGLLLVSRNEDGASVIT